MRRLGFVLLNAVLLQACTPFSSTDSPATATDAQADAGEDRDAQDASTAGIRCGEALTCNPAESACCTLFDDKPRCIPKNSEGSTCTGNVLRCDDALDCPGSAIGDQVCCATLAMGSDTNRYVRESSCRQRAGCSAPTEVILCDPTAPGRCSGLGSTCKADPGVGGVATCVP